MKKQTLISLAVLCTLIVLGFGLLNRNRAETTLLANSEVTTTHETNQNLVTKEFKEFPDFIYSIGPRFGGITKTELSKMTSIEAFLDNEVLKDITSVSSTSLTIVMNDEFSEFKANGQSKAFTREQLDFLKALKYSTNFVLRVDFTEIDKASGQLINNYRSPYHTIIPEKQAVYSEGKDALKLFLKDNIQTELIGVNPEKLKPAKLYFTITETGSVKNIRLDRDSGYPEVDKKMIKLMNHLPGTWTPANNDKGEPVEQELVVFFGLMGC
ncbi:MAG: hypothetical protein KDD05_08260 [Psychroserpens sp.]|nr:hypothetical protein [Psychroserpens sp.]